MKTTTEQKEIIHSEDNEIYVFSGAGTGKTSTLVERTKLHKYTDTMYIVFNKDMKIEAQSRFPERVTIETFHSLSYKYVGKDYKIEDISLKKISELCEVDIKTAYKIYSLIDFFCNSDLKKLEDLNSPLMDHSLKIWNLMLSKKIPIFTNVHLKLFELSNPDLSKYGIIMIDEAQDINAVGLSLINQQTKSQKIFIGDPNQRIYSFRGSLNIFKNIVNKYMLTKSFRFGPAIAEVANVILRLKESKMVIHGYEEVDSIVSFEDIPDLPITHIYRTNTSLFNKAIELTERNESVYIVGAEHVFDKILNALNLFEKRPVENDRFLETLGSYREFQGLANIMPEFKFIDKLIQSYGSSLRDRIYILKRASKKSSNNILVTAHKAKGMEFLYVKLGEDFQKISDASEEELNLIYVAITRATYYFTPNSDLKQYLS